MKSDIKKAEELLKNGEYTCVLCKEDTVYVSKERGVKPLLDFLDRKTDLKSFSAADKVVGKAAAFLYVLLCVKEVYAEVMSEKAAEVFSRNNIIYSCDKTAKNIINRAGTGLCPMEEAVLDITEPREATEAIRLRISQLSKKVDRK